MQIPCLVLKIDGKGYYKEIIYWQMKSPSSPKWNHPHPLVGPSPNWLDSLQVKTGQFWQGAQKSGKKGTLHALPEAQPWGKKIAKLHKFRAITHRLCDLSQTNEIHLLMTSCRDNRSASEIRYNCAILLQEGDLKEKVGHWKSDTTRWERLHALKNPEHAQKC